MLRLCHLVWMSLFHPNSNGPYILFTAFCLPKKCTLLLLNMDFIFAMWVTWSTALDFDVESTRLSPVSVVSWSFVIFCFAFGNVIHFTRSLFSVSLEFVCQDIAHLLPPLTSYMKSP